MPLAPSIAMKRVWELIMTDENLEGLKISVSDHAVSLRRVYPDGSVVQLTMPKPTGIDGQTREQAEALVQRMASRLLAVALEDLNRVV